MYFGTEEKTNYFQHKEKRDGSMNSTTSEKGTDGKPNNSSAYNHDYYMKNKEKWGVDYSEQTEGDSDFDDKNFTDENRLGDTDFYGIKGSDGSWTVIEENMKWKLPAGASREDIIKAVGDVSAKDKQSRMSAKDFEKAVSSALENMPGKSGKEFDVDAAANDVIRGKYGNGAARKEALGADYEAVQKRVNEKLKHSDDEEEYLEHHGIRGQKWGIRRFQNKDGTRTAAGKARERSESSEGSQNGGRKFHIDKKKAAIAGAVVVGAALLAHPTTRKALVEYGKTAVSKLPGLAKETAKGAGNALKESSKRVGNVMLDAALLSYGSVQIAKLEKKLDPGEDADQSTKDRNKIIFDTAKAGIEEATGANKSGASKKSGNKNPNVKVDKGSKEYQALFTQGMSDADRNKIKEAANKGASMEELKKMSNDMSHADLSEWIHASEFGSYIV